jgi:hypothetical protein
MDHMEHEQRLRAIAAEFGWQPRGSLPLVPEDRWSAEHPVARLAGEVLFLREQIRRVGDVMEARRQLQDRGQYLP